MRGINSCTIIGNVGKDPEFNGEKTPRLKFSVGVTDRDEKDGHTEWFNVILWGKLAEAMREHLTKGQLVYVEGRLETREYEDRDGNKKFWTDLHANQFRMLGGGRQEERREERRDDRGGNPFGGRRR